LTGSPISNHAGRADQSLKIRTVKRREHFIFNLLCFLYFRRSASHGIETRSFGIFIIIPYVLFSEIYFFRSQRYFVTADQQIVGLVALEERADAMFISVLAISPFHRRIGIAHFTLNHTVLIARKRGKPSVELAVTKMNEPALKLYKKFGFHLKEEKRRSCILQYQS